MKNLLLSLTLFFLFIASCKDKNDPEPEFKHWPTAKQDIQGEWILAFAGYKIIEEDGRQTKEDVTPVNRTYTFTKDSYTIDGNTQTHYYFTLKEEGTKLMLYRNPPSGNPPSYELKTFSKTKMEWTYETKFPGQNGTATWHYTWTFVRP